LYIYRILALVNVKATRTGLFAVGGCMYM